MGGYMTGIMGGRSMGEPTKTSSNSDKFFKAFSNVGNGGWAGGSGSGSSYSSTPIPTTNTANYDPQQKAILDRILARTSGDMGAGDAINVAGGKIREASIGAQKEAEAQRTARGVSGTGANDYDQRKISDATQKAIAGSATDISNKAEQDRNALLTGAAGVASNIAQGANADRQLAIQQWQAQQQAQQQQQQMQQNLQLAQLQMLSSMAGSLF